MVPQDDQSQREVDPQKESRAPLVEDLSRVCRWLNDRNSQYIVIGGMAMLRLGFTRATEDIDLLIKTDADNESRVIDAIAQLEDHAAGEIRPGEIGEYEVIRVADELTIDLMGKACGLTYDDAKNDIEWQEIDGVRIPFASATLMLKLKQSIREKDTLDRSFLISLLGPDKK